MLTLMAAFAESESEAMSENIKWGKRRRYEQGITGSITLNGMYGFRQNKGVVTIVEDEADLVRRIYKDFIDGYSYGEIADRLIADEVSTRMPGASWAKTTVQHIIRNEKYCGDCLFQKAFIANPITHQQVRNNGELPKYLVEDCLPAIVDKGHGSWRRLLRRDTHRTGRHRMSGIRLQGNCFVEFAVSLTTIIIIRLPIKSPLPHTAV